MQKQKLKIINKLGLHARAAMQLINHAGRFQCEIKIVYKNSEIDAKDILNVMSLGATQGNEIELIIDGTDEAAAMKDLTTLINNRFGEPE